MLAPGFRFYPTDEELISYYLKRKIRGRPIRGNAISEIDVYGAEPWDLPPLSPLGRRVPEWYFFTSLRCNRCRAGRATPEGHWRIYGHARPIQSRSRVIGTRKTLAYYAGRASRGLRTNWVMHEFRLEEDDLAGARNPPQDAYVLCRIFEKRGSGPQNRAQFAPFSEDEWERDALIDPHPAQDPESGALVPHVNSIMQDISWEYAAQLPETNLLYWDGLSNEVPSSEYGFPLETCIVPPAFGFESSEAVLSFYDNLPCTDPNQRQPDASTKVVGSSSSSKEAA